MSRSALLQGLPDGQLHWRIIVIGAIKLQRIDSDKAISNELRYLLAAEQARGFTGRHETLS